MKGVKKKTMISGRKQVCRKRFWHCLLHRQSTFFLHGRESLLFERICMGTHVHASIQWVGIRYRADDHSTSLRRQGGFCSQKKDFLSPVHISDTQGFSVVTWTRRRAAPRFFTAVSEPAYPRMIEFPQPVIFTLLDLPVLRARGSCEGWTKTETK